MDLRQLRYFSMVADELHFRRAAERLHITQAPLSLAIQALEHELGGALFLRTKRSVSLTDSGHALRAEARAILDRVERTRANIRDIAAGTVGRLRIAVTPGSALLPFFPTLISEFRSHHPKVSVIMREMTSKDQIAALQAQDIDIAIIRNPPQGAVGDIAFTKLLNDPLVVAMDRGHRMSRRSKLKLEELRDEPFVCYPQRSGIAIYDLVLRLCAVRGFTPHIVQEVQETSTLIGLAAIGLGIAVVPSGVAYIRVPNIVYKSLSDADVTTEVHLGHRTDENNVLLASFRRLAQLIVVRNYRHSLKHVHGGRD